MKGINIIFDGNYLFHKSFGVFATYYKGADMLEVLSEKKNRDIFIRKCVIDMCYAVNQFVNVSIERVIVVIDSHSWRHDVYDNYKYSKTRVKEPWYDLFIQCLAEFEKLLRSRDLIVSRINGAEGDDLMYIWSCVLSFYSNDEPDTVIITADSDIRQLVSKTVSVFSNNSKNLNVWCLKENAVAVSNMFNTDMRINTVVPEYLIIKKVILGDISDNIPKVWNGIGEKTLDKFFTTIGLEKLKEMFGDLKHTAENVSKAFCDFFNSKYPEMNYEDVYSRIEFNLRMTWLNVFVYTETDEGTRFFERMLDEVNSGLGKYNYNKAYTLEQFYGLPIK